jgi:hypothetical protein
VSQFVLGLALEKLDSDSSQRVPHTKLQPGGANLILVRLRKFEIAFRLFCSRIALCRYSKARERTLTMTALAHRSLTAIAIFLVIVNHIFAQQPKPSNRELIQTKLSRFATYADDFTALARAASGDHWKIPSDLHDTAIDACGYILAVRALLEIHDQLSCQADRGRVWLVITRELHYYTQRIDVDIKKVNLHVSSTKARAVTSSGEKM